MDTKKHRVKHRGLSLLLPVYAKGKRFWAADGTGGLNFLRFSGPYMIHSLPIDRSWRVVDATIGKTASHGCIRVSMEDSQWLYQNIGVGTPVWIN